MSRQTKEKGEKDVAEDKNDIKNVLITDSYIGKRIIISVIMIACVGIGYYGQYADPANLTWIGRIGGYFNMAVFPLFFLYGYFWWKGRQERKRKDAARRDEMEREYQRKEELAKARSEKKGTKI